MYCKKCGAEIGLEAKFCPKCGAHQRTKVTKDNEWSAAKCIAAPFLYLLAILLFWGLVVVIGNTFAIENSLFLRIVKLAVPILILIGVFLVPVGIAFGVARILDKE